MPAKRKDLGNYKEIIQTYLRQHKDLKTSTMSRTELNLLLNVDNKYIHDCRRRATKWQKDFIKEYDKACSKIAKSHFKDVLKIPQYKWLYLRSNHKYEFEDLSNDENVESTNNNIIINLSEPRKIENE